MIMDIYKKKYNEALKRARKAYQNIKPENIAVKTILEEAFPQLRESEDERIRKEIINICDEWLNGGWSARPCLNDILWLKNLLEKQKELSDPEEIMNHPLYLKGFDVGRKVGQVEKELKSDNLDEQDKIVVSYQLGRSDERKEQKPVEIHNPTDEEVESWKNELTEFMKFATKQAKENQLHISYTRDVMWENFCSELLSFVNSRKPVEWSEEDEKNWKSYIERLESEYHKTPNVVLWDDINWLKYLHERLKSLRPQPKPNVTDGDIEEMVNERARKSGTTKSEMAFYRNGIKDAIKRFGLRPSWKPSEEQMEALYTVCYIPELKSYGGLTDWLKALYEQLKKLM